MDFIERLKNQTPTWLSADGPYPETIVSTRVRIARNLESFLFPPAATESTVQEVWETTQRVLRGILPDAIFTEIITLSDLERAFLVERKLASPDLIRRLAPGVGCAFSTDETLSILINEEDHLRIQVFAPALRLNDAFNKAIELDRKIGGQLEYAFLGDFGFLTTSLTNTGLGLRISVLAHLPGIVLTRKVEEFVQIVQKSGLSVRGLYGEWSQARGNLFQVSTAQTLNISEEDLLERFRLSVVKILKLEKKARDELWKDYRVVLEDKVYRSLAILKNARTLSFEEAAIHLSFLRLGVGLGILMDLPLPVLNEILFFSQVGHIQMLMGEGGRDEQDIHRAMYIRTKLQNYS